jgi:hypothetical protein
MENLKNFFTNILKSLSYFFLFLFLVFVTTETWFRLTPEEPPLKYCKNIIQARLAPFWLDKKNTNPLMPPFKIFSNTDFGNEERLKLIAKEMSLPRNAKLTAYDFLRSADVKDKTRYTATINNLGFRDPPRTIEKPKNVFRIIVLGSYHAFGHAVNDEQTYSRQLERMLNDRKIDGITFEVWNGGRHAASAIAGLARLKTEVLNDHPDLIIWDYGLVDPSILGDDFFPISYILPNAGVYRWVNGLLDLTRNQLATKSLTFSRIMDSLIERNKSKNIAAFKKVTEKMLWVTQKNNIPVVLLQHTIVNPRLYKEIRRERIFKHAAFVNGRDIFIKYPPSAAATEEFYSTKNWFSEFDPALAIGSWQFPVYFTDLLQYSAEGHKAIARYLADQIGSALAEKPLLKSQQYKSQAE